MLINATDPEEARIAVVQDGILTELHVEVAGREAYLGNIYKGRVVNVEPAIGAAFVAFGGRSNGFLHASDILPAYARPEFVLDDVVEGRARVTGDEGPEAVRAILAESNGDADDDADGGDESGAGDAPIATATDAAVDAGTSADEFDAGADEFGSDIEHGSDDDEHEGAPDARGAGPDDSDGGGDATSVTAEATTAEDGAATATVTDGQAVKERGRRGRRVRREKPRTRVPVDQLLRKGQEVIVQVTKEGIGAKGPTLTTFVSLPGRSLVLMPSLPKCGVSRKIEDPKERRRLKRIVRELDETGSGGVGFIVRTNGVEKSKLDLQRDRDYLKKIWELVAQRVKVTRAPALLYQESDLVLKAMRDHFSPEIEEVVVDARDVWLRIRDFAEKLMPHMADRIKLHESHTPLFHSFGIETEVEKLYQPRIELPNGGSIVIEQAEALVAIDVNSGRFKPGTELEHTAFRTNLEAIPEIVRQLRLRDLGGLILIDFIDMNEERHRRQIERAVVDALRGDRARIKVGRISPFGLLEITRQRVGPGLKHTVFSSCRHCGGSGMARTVQSKALAVLREVRAIIGLKGFSVLQVFVAPAVNDYIVNYKRRPLLDLEEAIGKTVVVRGEPSYPVDVVHYRFLTADGQEARIAIPAGLGVKV
ncbi:MAG: Rne/Rng family ribonuclease [Planctomycetes bacterium]|nr:Rne/Rng family ribonuclease [Planctomycetota bacterium]